MPADTGPGRERVIALRCTGGGTGQWDSLERALGGKHDFHAPEYFGSENIGAWTGEHAFTLAHEAARSVALIDQTHNQVHLVGHSYGGGVALKVGLARPRRIRTMTLYEPSAFHLLPQMGAEGAAAHREICGVVNMVRDGVLTGDYRKVLATFIDYWNGLGSWDAISPNTQAALVRLAPKLPLDFRALMEEPTPAEAYRGLNIPTLVLRGEHAPRPTRLIAEELARMLPRCRLSVIAGAGHMGPVTHADDVAVRISRNIANCRAGAYAECR